MKRPEQYRIRWAVVYVRRDARDRRCIAERKIRLLGIPLFWFPVEGDWHSSEVKALQDIDRDRYLREPLPPVRNIGG